MKSVCRYSHQCIISGECPWCGITISSSRDHEKSESNGGNTIWDANALSSIVASGNSDAATTSITNGIVFSNSISTALAVGRVGLNHENTIITYHSELSLLQLGLKLSDEQSDLLEESLGSVNSGSDAFAVRVLSLGALFLRKRRSIIWRTRRSTHVIWLISNKPVSYTCGSPYCDLSDIEDRAAYEIARKTWEHNILLFPDNVSVLKNAAGFFKLTDSARSKHLYERAKELNSRDADLPMRLGHLIRHDNPATTNEQRRKMALEALKECELALQKNVTPIKKIYILSSLIDYALESGDLHRAETSIYDCQSLLDMFGEAITSDKHHDFYLLRGRCALLQFQFDIAEQWLDKASDYPCAPGSGPDLRLAQQLLDAGKTKAVVRYLCKCKNYWEGAESRLSEWIVQIEKEGKTHWSDSSTNEPS